MKNDSLVSNMDNEDKELVIEAAKLSRLSGILYIEPIATYGKDKILEDHFGLHTEKRRTDPSKFWRKFEELKRISINCTKFSIDKTLNYRYNII